MWELGDGGPQLLPGREGRTLGKHRGRLPGERGRMGKEAEE